jgi:phosphotransferase system IIB component
MLSTVNFVLQKTSTMNRKLLLLPLFAVVVTLPNKAKSQDDVSERKISIEIKTTENGETTTKSLDLDNATDQEIEEALREMGIMDHFTFHGDDEDVLIDIRRFTDGQEAEHEMRIRMMPPMAPMPGMPPMPPMPAEVSEKYTWLGVSTEKVTEELKKEKKVAVNVGVLVLEVHKGSPAEAAGLEEGDVITQVDGKEIADPKSLSETIRAKKPGDNVKITYYREKKKGNVTATLAEHEVSQTYSFNFNDGEQWKRFHEDGDWKKEAMEPRAFLGVTPGDDEDITGAMIGSVEEGSAAERMGLKEGDIIRSVNGEKIDSFGDLSRKIRSMKPGDAVALKVMRGGAEQQISGELGEKKMEQYLLRERDGDQHMFEFDRNFEHAFGPEEREELRREMDELREEMDRLREELGADIQRSTTRIRIESKKLSEEEKALLKNKGVKGLENDLELGDLNIFPNPSRGFYRIAFDVKEKADLEVDVHDASGERVYQEKITGFNGKYERTLDLSDKASGTYFLVIQQNGKATSRKLVKE